MCHIPSRRLSAIALGCLLTSVFIVGVAAYPFLPPEQVPSGAATAMADRKQGATAPTSRENEPWWLERHEDALDRIKQGKIDLLFIGDSITQGWETEGEGVWQERYAPCNAVNLGFSGDRTQHVLWRLQNGEIDLPEGCVPKLAIVMIGTNNSNGDDYTAEEIAAGITKIVKTLRDKLPKTKVLLLAIFPRGEQMNPQRDKNAIASDKASNVADGKMVHYLDIGSKFMNEDKTISREIMPDHLHLSARGYQIWGEAMEEKVKELMGETETGSQPKPAQP